MDMELTKVKQTSIIHRDSAHAGGRIFGGQLLNKSIQVAILSMIELCELSLHGQKDANGAAVPLIPASESVKHIHLASTDICKFY